MSKKAATAKEVVKPTPPDAIPFSPVQNDGVIHTDAPDVSGETVTMVFPKKVHLTLSHHQKVEFKPGIQEVPEAYADHEWLKQNGVMRYEKE